MDVYKEVAARLLGVRQEDVTVQQRQQIKQAAYAYMYSGQVVFHEKTEDLIENIIRYVKISFDAGVRPLAGYPPKRP